MVIVPPQSLNTFLIYRIFSIKRRTPNKRRVQMNDGYTGPILKKKPQAFIRGPGVYLRCRRLFEMGILNQDYVS